MENYTLKCSERRENNEFEVRNELIEGAGKFMQINTAIIKRSKLNFQNQR